MTTPVQHAKGGRALHRDFGIAIDTLPDGPALTDMLARACLVVVRGWHGGDTQLLALADALGTHDGFVKQFSANGPREDQRWHHVGHIDDEPARATLLYPAQALTAAPGMAFVSMHAAWRALPQKLQDQLESATATHVFTAAPGRTSMQPLVRDNGDRGPSLFLGYHAVRMNDATGTPLLERLMKDATAPDRVYTHHFEPGDLLIWDNRALIHRACALPSGAARVVREISVY